MDVVLSILLPAVGMHSPRDVLNDQDIADFLNLTPSDDTTTPGTLCVYSFILNIIYIFWFLFNLELRPRIQIEMLIRIKQLDQFVAINAMSGANLVIVWVFDSPKIKRLAQHDVDLASIGQHANVVLEHATTVK